MFVQYEYVLSFLVTVEHQFKLSLIILHDISN